ncbi:hypothetical protein FE634_00830 [Nocardioides dongxiaopingii]|uniref:hypothetical protein n=1 Tax=Nocardioides sp. S-1144 TaxID=2582905 RepID=UPI00110F581A|nr:hypothetical protein [Nocardioides sp. S-1144]QCW49322.1 hypothetical protein FE634_00830 [Nocardioides sp. S-1144]
MPPTHLAGLLQRAARHDCDAFATFYDRTIDNAYHLARIVSAHPDDVDQIVGAAYLNAWLDSASHGGTGYSPRAWLMVLVELNAADPARRGS